MNAARVAMRYRATIERPVKTADRGGGQITTWPTIASTIPCWAWMKPASPTSAGIRVEGGKLVVVDERRIIVPLGTDVRVGDRVTVRDRRQTRVIFDRMLIDAVGERAEHVLLIARTVA